MQDKITQIPEAGARLIYYTGDLLEVKLQVPFVGGRAFVRTSHGSIHRRHEETIAEVEERPRVRQSLWEDVEMRMVGDGVFSAMFPLCEVGVYEYKACYVASDGKLHWAPGDNLTVKVEPAFSVANNTIYNAFIRQFGRNISQMQETKEQKNAEYFLTQNGYIVIPPSGKMRDFKEKLPHIMDKMGFRIVLFLPIHPLPSSYGRMGHYGSPFAPLDFYEVEPDLAVFNKMHTPVQQFCELLDCIHARNGKAFIDIPFDHTGWASSMQNAHPEWFKHTSDGSFESPGAWGVTWEDLCKLDFTQKTLWIELANIILHWCRLGVDGFRCDAGYMVPKETWTYITAKVREQYPDTIFLLEGLGGSVDTTRELLEEGMMNWAYSESFQQFGLEAESGYLYHSLELSSHCGTLVNFAETHDNNRLAATSAIWSIERTASAALLAPAGAFGIANGVEWLATEKIDVHQAASLNWGASHNIIDHISSLNAILFRHPAFSAKAALKRPETLLGTAYGLLREASKETVLVLVNPSNDTTAKVSWNSQEFAPSDKPYDLITNRRIQFNVNGECYAGELPPSTVVCIAKNIIQYDYNELIPAQILQEAKASVLRLLCATKHESIIQDNDLNELAELLLKDRDGFNSKLFPEYIPIIDWFPSRDCRREVILPAFHAIIISAQHPFCADLRKRDMNLERIYSLKGEDGTYFAFVTTMAMKDVERHERRELFIHCRLFENNTSFATECIGKITLLPYSHDAKIPMIISTSDILTRHCGICTNLSGSYSIARAAWGTLQSKYDALLAANPSISYPDNRLATLVRCRAWLRYRDCSCELMLNNQNDFMMSYENVLQWSFQVSFSSLLTAQIKIFWELDRHSNAGCMTFAIENIERHGNLFDEEDEQITLIVRPDIDWRSNHSVTKAYMGAEVFWPQRISLVGKNGFAFAPDQTSNQFTMQASNGTFNLSPQWQYQIPLPVEQERGLETEMDLFSPGYFELPICQNENVTVRSCLTDGKQTLTAFKSSSEMAAFPTAVPFGDALRKSLDYFVVKRDAHKSIIAGYPWFLDWGRDTLICLRGMIAAEMFEDARDTILQFARFADQGTLPNMIRGNDTSDRQTSDAPLWLFSAIHDYILAAPDGNRFLAVEIDGKTLVEILDGILEDIYNGRTCNGVKADKESGLVYSPAHYTWMDTNYPAGTPRSGYPVEIQALWLHALNLIAGQGGRFSRWKSVEEKARGSFARFFFRRTGKGLCDCLHCNDFAPAVSAEPDDACRPNQLLAVTLRAVTDKATLRSVIQACSKLLTPAGIRSLDDAPVEYPQPVVDHGVALNDPHAPYQGYYTGSEDSKRKPAYHNGTSWAWQMPFFCEAEYLCFGEAAKEAALAQLSSAMLEMTNGCIGFLPEIYDGDAPHAPKGCLAQAWSMTEFYRVWKILQPETNNL